MKKAVHHRHGGAGAQQVEPAVAFPNQLQAALQGDGGAQVGRGVGGSGGQAGAGADEAEVGGGLGQAVQLGLHFGQHQQHVGVAQHHGVAAAIGDDGGGGELAEEGRAGAGDGHVGATAAVGGSVQAVEGPGGQVVALGPRHRARRAELLKGDAALAVAVHTGGELHREDDFRVVLIGQAEHVGRVGL